MHGLDRTALLHSKAAAEAEDARKRVRTLSRELAEFKEVHSATIDSLRSELDRARGDATEQHLAADQARAEAKAAREELEAYKKAEADRHQAFLKSREFKGILGPKAYKFLMIGLQSCKDQFAEAGLVLPDAAVDLPDINKAIASVPDDILEDAIDEAVQENQEGAEDPKTN